MTYSVYDCDGPYAPLRPYKLVEANDFGAHSLDKMDEWMGVVRPYHRKFHHGRWSRFLLYSSDTSLTDEAYYLQTCRSHSCTKILPD